MFGGGRIREVTGRPTLGSRTLTGVGMNEGLVVRREVLQWLKQGLVCEREEGRKRCHRGDGFSGEGMGPIVDEWEDLTRVR